MKMHHYALAAVLGLATYVSAGELDREFKGSDVKGLSTASQNLSSPTGKSVTATELDDESPTQAWRRGGWGGGWGWGGGISVGYGWGRGYGWGGGWGSGYLGGYWPSYGSYSSFSYWPSYYYQPSYSFYYPAYSYSFYPSWSYGGYYRGRGCCIW